VSDVPHSTPEPPTLATSEAALHAILEHTPAAVFMRDLEGRWVVTNPRLCEAVGRSAEDLRGEPISQTHSPREFEQFSADDRAVLEAGEAREFDVVYHDASKGEDRHFWLVKFPVRDADGTIIGLGGISSDVTDRERVQRELAAARELFEQAFEHALVGMMITQVDDDGSSEIVRCNPAFAAMLGHDAAELLGRRGAGLLHPDDLPERRRMLGDLLAGRPAAGELRFLHRDGHDVWALVASTMVESADGERLHVLQALDISERKVLEDRLRHLADHDALTGLFGRRRFEEELGREVARAHRHAIHGCLLMLDLDGFKTVNDSFGHSVGDALLQQLATGLRATLREGDVLARLGGDEFAVVLPDTDLAGGRAVAAKLVDTVRRDGHVVVGGRSASVTASAGIAAIRGSASPDAETLLMQADVAMYAAKDAGKDGVAVHAGPRPASRLPA
jgi:diguanylate cyclase (GGDEF)-like protein/PAS domain S-box-containing protein